MTILQNVKTLKSCKIFEISLFSFTFKSFGPKLFFEQKISLTQNFWPKNVKCQKLKKYKPYPHLFWSGGAPKLFLASTTFKGVKMKN